LFEADVQVPITVMVVPDGQRQAVPSGLASYPPEQVLQYPPSALGTRTWFLAHVVPD